MTDAAAPAPAARAVTGALIRGFTRYSPLIILAVLWEGVARLGLVSGSSLPALSSVAAAWVDLLRSGDLPANTACGGTRCVTSTTDTPGARPMRTPFISAT